VNNADASVTDPGDAMHRQCGEACAQSWLARLCAARGRTQLRESAPLVIGDVLGTLPGVDNSKDSPWEQKPIVRGLSGQRRLLDDGRK